MGTAIVGCYWCWCALCNAGWAIAAGYWVQDAAQMPIRNPICLVLDARQCVLIYFLQSLSILTGFPHCIPIFIEFPSPKKSPSPNKHATGICYHLHVH